MRITVISVDQDQVALVRGTSALGWRGKFGCPLGVGEAVFIPSRGLEDNLRPGNSIDVETGYEEISDFRAADPNAPEVMQPLDCPGDYRLRGKVVQVAPLGNVQISVRGLPFTLERDALCGSAVAVGDFVEFTLHGLSFWDAAQ